MVYRRRQSGPKRVDVGRLAARRGGSHFSRRRVSMGGFGSRLLLFCALAVIVGIIVGLVLPKVSKPFAQMTGQYIATGPAADSLGALAVDDRPSKAGYDRDSFLYNTVDKNGDGCTVRDDVLKRDMEQQTVRLTRGCHVGSGTLKDPYTGRDIKFVRGQRTSSAVQIDHVVALENAWQSGAKNWSASQREQYGNDTYNLLAVDGPANQEKGSASAAYWLPANRSYDCAYVARQIGVKTKYKLTVTTKEKQAMGAVLRGCPSQQIPSR